MDTDLTIINLNRIEAQWTIVLTDVLLSTDKEGLGTLSAFLSVCGGLPGEVAAISTCADDKPHGLSHICVKPPPHSSRHLQ